MIGINVISIAQSVNLTTGMMDNILVLQLPDGTEVNAVVPESVVDKVYALANGGAATQAPVQQPLQQQPPMQQPPSASIPQQEPGVPPSEVHWLSLPDNQLPIHMKSALKYLNVPEGLTINALQNLLGQIEEKFGDTEWAEVQERYPNGPYEAAPAAPQQASVMPQQTPQPPPQPPLQVHTTGLQAPSPQAPRPQPPLQQVMWSDGSPMIPGQQNRGRTVPANKAGFPIAGDGSMDPGEIVAGGEEGDEDGVAQF